MCCEVSAPHHSVASNLETIALVKHGDKAGRTGNRLDEDRR